MLPPRSAFFKGKTLQGRPAWNRGTVRCGDGTGRGGVYWRHAVQSLLHDACGSGVQLLGISGDAVSNADSQGVQVVIAFEPLGLAGIGAVPELDQNAGHA